MKKGERGEEEKVNSIERAWEDKTKHMNREGFTNVIICRQRSWGIEKEKQDEYCININNNNSFWLALLYSCGKEISHPLIDPSVFLYDFPRDEVEQKRDEMMHHPVSQRHDYQWLSVPFTVHGKYRRRQRLTVFRFYLVLSVTLVAHPTGKSEAAPVTTTTTGPEGNAIEREKRKDGRVTEGCPGSII